MAKTRLAAPWTVLYRQVQALFRKDGDVRVAYDEEGPAIRLYVDGSAKADALVRLLPESRTFGNVTVTIQVVPGNRRTESTGDLLTDAFSGNEALSFIHQGGGTAWTPTFRYVVFKAEVVQFYNDDLSDVHGLCSTLYADVARDVLKPYDGTYYCTDAVGRLGMPLGEWP